MITLIKFLVLLFLLLLGYDTVNLFLTGGNSEETTKQLGISFENENVKQPIYTLPISSDFSQFRTSFFFWLIGISTIILSFIVMRKWRTEQNNRIAELVIQLRSLSEQTENSNDSVNADGLHQTDSETSLNEQTHAGLLDCQPSPSNDIVFDNKKCNFFLEETLINDPVIEEAILSGIQSNPFPIFGIPGSNPVSLLQKIPSLLTGTPNATFTLKTKPNGQSGSATLASLQDNPAEGQQFMTKSPNSFPFRANSLPMSFILPAECNESENCKCNLTGFEERLTEVEKNLKSTENVSFLWRNRIEQTEDELLELQQQIHCLILDWNVNNSKINVFNDFNEYKASSVSDESDTKIIRDLAASKPLQLLSQIIEDSKRQLQEEEEEEVAAESIEKEENQKSSSENIVQEVANSSASELCLPIKKHVTTSISKEFIKDNLDLNDSPKLYCDVDELIADGSVKCNRANNNKEDGLRATDDAEELNFIVENERQKMELFYRNEELKNESINLVHDIENMYNYEESGQSRGFVRPKLNVPSHIVAPRQVLIKRYNRPQPRCAYSLLSKQD